MREIITQKNAGSTRQRDEYTDRIIKLIPAEVVALYIGLEGILVASGQNSGMIFWFIFVVCLVGTPVYLMKVANVKNTVQIVISTVAFVIWVLALGGPFATELPTLYKSIYGAVLVPIYTFFAPMFIEK